MSNRREYELTVVFHTQLEEDARNNAIERILSMVAIDESDEALKPVVTHWGLRNLAYEIKKQREGYYVFFDGPMNGPKIREIEREFSYNENILRHLFVRKEAE